MGARVSVRPEAMGRIQDPPTTLRWQLPDGPGAVSRSAGIFLRRRPRTCSFSSVLHDGLDSPVLRSDEDSLSRFHQGHAELHSANVGRILNCNCTSMSERTRRSQLGRRPYRQSWPGDLGSSAGSRRTSERTLKWSRPRTSGSGNRVAGSRVRSCGTPARG
jgi:hypothetical protein